MNPDLIAAGFVPEEPTIDGLLQQLADKCDLIDNMERGRASLRDDLDTMNKALHMAEESYRQCDTKLKDALVEIENLRAWKKEALTVESWWKKVDDAVRKHPSAKLGTLVSDEALRLIQERDTMINGALHGELTNAGTMRVGDEESVTGFFVRCSREQMRAVKHLPMYRRVAIVLLPT